MLLLDTHALIWWLPGDARLSARARDTIDLHREQVYVSAASAWEITTKVRLGKAAGRSLPGWRYPTLRFGPRLSVLAVSIEHGERAGALPGPVKDSFDRMLIAQAMLDGLQLVSIEQAFDAYSVLRLW